MERVIPLIAGIFIHGIGLLAVEVNLESQAEKCLQRHRNEELLGAIEAKRREKHSQMGWDGANDELVEGTPLIGAMF